MNKLISVAQAGKLFGFTGSAHEVARKTRRRLRAIADNDPSFVLFKPIGTNVLHTTIQDIRRVIPELFIHDPDCSEDVIDTLDELQEKSNKLAARIERLERVQFVKQVSHETAHKSAQQGIQ